MNGAIRRVCVYSGSSPGARPTYLAHARALGTLLAGRGIGLVYGGASVGLMGAVADATVAAGGEVTGIIPEALVAKEIAHKGLTDLRVVATMHERKALMAELSDAFVALPGGYGTFEELFETITWAQLGMHTKPIGLLNTEGYFDPLVALVARSVDEGFVRPVQAGLFVVAPEPGELLRAIEEFVPPPPVRKWVELPAT